MSEVFGSNVSEVTMNCPTCGKAMQTGIATLSVNPRQGWWNTLLRLFFYKRGDERLWFGTVDDAQTAVVLGREEPRVAHHCSVCRLLVVAVDPPPKPLEWVFRIAQQQQGRAQRRAVYDVFRKHRIPHPVASSAANAFHAGTQVRVPSRDPQTAMSVVADLRALGLEAEVVEPAIGKANGGRDESREGRSGESEPKAPAEQGIRSVPALRLFSSPTDELGGSRIINTSSDVDRPRCRALR